MENKIRKGHDDLSNKFSKEIYNGIVDPLSIIFNKSMSEGAYPGLYKIAKITPLYKAKDKYLFVNYRPVSVLISVSKVLERLMYNRMYDFFTDCEILVSTF